MLKGSRIWHSISFSCKRSALAGAIYLRVGIFFSSTLSCSLFQLSVPFSHSVHNLYPPPFCVFAFSLYFSSSVIYQLPNQLWILFDSILGSLASHHVLTLVVRSVTSLVQSSTLYAVHVVSLNPCFHCFFLCVFTSLLQSLLLLFCYLTSQYAGSFYGTTAIRVFFLVVNFHTTVPKKETKLKVSLLQLLGWFLNLSKKVRESLMFEEMDFVFNFLLHPKVGWHFGTVWRKPWIVFFFLVFQLLIYNFEL